MRHDENLNLEGMDQSLIEAVKRHWEKDLPEFPVGAEPWQIYSNGWINGIDHYAAQRTTAGGRKYLAGNFLLQYKALIGLAEWMIEDLEDFIRLRPEDDEPEDPNQEEVVLYDALNKFIDINILNTIKRFAGDV